MFEFVKESFDLTTPMKIAQLILLFSSKFSVAAFGTGKGVQI